MAIANVRLVFDSHDTLSGLAARQGITPVAGDAILAAGQTDGTQNGIWVASAAGWSRHADYNDGAEFIQMMSFGVLEGTWANSRWHLTNQVTPVVGSSILNFDMWARDEVLRAAGGLTIDESANTVGVPSSGVDAGVYGADSYVEFDTLGFAIDAGNGFGAETFVKGLTVTRSGTGAVSVSEGAAYSPVHGEVINHAGGVHTFGTPSSAAWWGVYLQAGIASNAQFTVAEYPANGISAPYAGYARHMDTSGDADPRRLLMWIRSLTNNIHEQVVEGDGNNPFVRYLTPPNVAPFRLLTAGTATAATTVSAALAVPPTSRLALIRFLNTSDQQAFITHSDLGVVVEHVWDGGADKDVLVPLNSVQAFKYHLAAAPASGGLYADVLAYQDRR